MTSCGEKKAEESMDMTDSTTVEVDAPVAA